jgi:hypothetical protein
MEDEKEFTLRYAWGFRVSERGRQRSATGGLSRGVRVRTEYWRTGVGNG